MAGIKIHQYPLERTSIGDEDFYDIDYWTGSSYQSAKIKGSTLKNVLGADYIDITTFISGYELTDKDAGKLITNSNSNVRTLVIPSGLALPNNMITVKGRIAIQPETGVNITLPDGSTITDPAQFTCVADEVYILHKSAFSGDNYILVSIKKSENIGTNDLIITDTIRELQVATDGTLQIVTNDANNSAIFRVGENSNERFNEIEFNTVIFDLLSKFQNPSITAGVIVEVNPNEFKFIVLPDTSNTSVYHGLINADANKTIIEKSNAGKFMFDSSLSINTFEDLRATKKGLEYSADYSANFSVRSLVDKGYVDAGLSNKIGAVIEDTTPQLGGNLDLNGNDINGTGNVDITGNVIADIVQLKGGTGTQGEISWSTDEETVKLIMDGTTLYMGQDTFVHVRNNTASIITKGTAVYATGTLGASGRITVAPMIANGTIAGRLFIGLAAEDIAIGADGQVCSYGKIRGINTTAYNDGDVLWLSPTVAGQLTATEPTAPNLKIATAFVIHDATNGTLMVRAEQGNDLHSDQRVQVSGLTNNDILTWNNTNQRWQNAQPTINNIYTINGTIGSNRVATLTDTLSFSGGRVSFDTTTNGILLPRLTTVQMNGISSPATNLLVFNTDLNGLYRYNGSSWVALAVGYGIIGVYSGSGNGTPTFFATLQDALETCKASGGYFTVKLYSNLTITSAIEIDYANTGVGNAYLFRQLTIDFNGFSVTNAQANTSNAFTIELSNSASVYQEIKFINGTVLRTNGTGTHHALQCDTINRFGTVQMSNMLWYCQNNQCARINLGLSTAVDASTVMDLGGSKFISGGTGRTCTFNNAAQTICNFYVRSTSSLDAFYPDTGRYYNFYAENTSSGAAVLAVGSNAIIANFNCRSNSGKALDLNGTGMEAHNFTAKSTSGMAVDVKGGATATLFKCDTGNAVALNIEGNSTVKHAYAQNNSGSVGAVTTNDANIVEDVTGVNLGASFGGRLQNTTALRGTYNKCTFRSIGGIGAEVISTTSVIDLDTCNFESQLDTSGGHACRVQSVTAGTFLLTKCDFKVRNAGANCLNAAAATTVRSRYSTHNDVATTPINANVTIVSSGIIS